MRPAARLTAILAELTREDERAAVAKVTTDPSTIHARTHQYAAARLSAVAKVIAARFRA